MRYLVQIGLVSDGGGVAGVGTEEFGAYVEACEGFRGAVGRAEGMGVGHARIQLILADPFTGQRSIVLERDC